MARGSDSMLGRAAVVARRAAGALLVLLTVFPLYRLLADRETGLAGAATIAATDARAQSAWMGAFVIMLCALLAGILVTTSRAETVVHRVRAWIERSSSGAFALGAALLAALASTAFILLVTDGRTDHADAMVQLLHARFIADGRLAGPAGNVEFWMIQNSLVTPRGWVSQYPPGHILLLAAGFAASAVWLIPVLAHAVMVAFTALAGARLLPGRPAIARLGALLVAGSALMLIAGGTYMNHVPTAALLAAGVYAALRARDGSAAWAIGAGACAGAAFAVRPLSALAIAGPVFLVIWLGTAASATRRFPLLAARAVAGAAPFIAAVLMWNAHFFGSPFRFGYAAALGPDTGLGFRRDPWGNAYGPLEALGFTSADLTGFGVAFLESPASLVVVVGLLLLLARRLSVGERVLAVWALAPVAANALYWHHQPRMLLETGPAWAMLFVAAATHAWNAANRFAPAVRFSPRSAVAAGFTVFCALSIGWLGPGRMLAAAPPAAAVVVPQVAEPSIIFVHDAWRARLAMQLAGAGMRLDSVETMLRQNPTCTVQRLVDARARGDDAAWRAGLDALDMTPRASGFPPAIRISRGNTIRMHEGEVLAPECARQIASDQGGVLDIAPLVWQGDVPGATPYGALIARDLGPERNDALLRTLPHRTPFVYYTPTEDAPPALVPYARGMAAIWGEDVLAHEASASRVP